MYWLNATYFVESFKTSYSCIREITLEIIKRTYSVTKQSILKLVTHIGLLVQKSCIFDNISNKNTESNVFYCFDLAYLFPSRCFFMRFFCQSVEHLNYELINSFNSLLRDVRMIQRRMLNLNPWEWVKKRCVWSSLLTINSKIK